MLSVKSNGVEKQMPTRDDVEFIKPTLSVTGSKIQELSNGLFSHNKYSANFCGYIKMNACSVNAAEKLLTLPVTAEWSNAYLFAKLNATPITLYVRENGLYVQNANSFEKDDYLFITGSYPIISGGGYSVDLLKVSIPLCLKEWRCWHD